ncbi:MAG TPA: tetratricopeptide repeat protein, partial [Ktedonobacteraceae bacterium]
EALVSYEEALRLDPQDEDILLDQARTLDSLKRFDEALQACERAIQLAPENPSVYKKKGDLLTRQKQHKDALIAYQLAVQHAPKDAFAYEQVGDTLCELERFADAVKAYDRALRLMPDFTRVYKSKAQALEKLGRYEQALAAYNKALELEPKHFSLLVDRAGVLKKLLRYEEANAEYQRAELNAPEPWYAIICLFGKVDLKQVAEAKTRLQAAGKELSDDAIQAEIHLMYEEKRAAELKASLRASPLFQPLCLLMQEQKEWSGTPKQFKELICSRFPEEFATWYRAPYKYVDELEKIAPELRVEGIAVGVPPETTLITLARTVIEVQLDRSEEATPDTTKEAIKNS